MSQRYSNRIKCTREYENRDNYYITFTPLIIGNRPLYDETVFRQILTFSRDLPYQVYKNKYKPDSLWVENAFCVETLPAPDSPELICQDYVQRLDSLAQTYIKETKNSQTIRCAVPSVF